MPMSKVTLPSLHKLSDPFNIAWMIMNARDNQEEQSISNQVKVIFNLFLPLFIDYYIFIDRYRAQ